MTEQGTSYWWSIGSFVSNYFFKNGDNTIIKYDENRENKDKRNSEIITKEDIQHLFEMHPIVDEKKEYKSKVEERLGSSTLEVEKEQRAQIELLFDLKRMKCKTPIKRGATPKKEAPRRNLFDQHMETPKINIQDVTTQQHWDNEELKAIIEQENKILNYSLRKTMTPPKVSPYAMQATTENSMDSEDSQISSPIASFKEYYERNIIDDETEIIIDDEDPTQMIIIDDEKNTPHNKKKKLLNVMNIQSNWIMSPASPVVTPQENGKVWQMVLMKLGTNGIKKAEIKKGNGLAINNMEEQMVDIYNMSIAYVLSTMATTISNRLNCVESFASFAQLIETGSTQSYHHRMAPGLCLQTLLSATTLFSKEVKVQNHYSELLHHFISCTNTNSFELKHQVAFLKQMVDKMTLFSSECHWKNISEDEGPSHQLEVTKNLKDVLQQQQSAVTHLFQLTQKKMVQKLLIHLEHSEQNEMVTLQAYDWHVILDGFVIPELTIYCCHL